MKVAEKKGLTMTHPPKDSQITAKKLLQEYAKKSQKGDLNQDLFDYQKDVKTPMEKAEAAYCRMLNIHEEINKKYKKILKTVIKK